MTQKSRSFFPRKRRKERSYKISFQQLNSVQKRIIRNKRIKGSGTTTQWLTLFQKLIIYDERQSRVYQRVGHIFSNEYLLLFLAIAHVSVFGTFANYMMKQDLILVPFVTFGVLAFLVAYAYEQLRKSYLPTYFRTVVVPLVMALHEEIEPGTALNLNVDLRHRFNNAHYRKDLSIFQWNFLQASAQLRDRTRLKLSIQILNNYRGHRKYYKIKSKRKVKFQLTMEYHKKAHPMIYPLRVSHPYKEKSQEKANKYVIRLRHVLKFKDKPFKERMYQDIPIKELINLIKTGYHMTVKGQKSK